MARYIWLTDTFDGGGREAGKLQDVRVQEDEWLRGFGTSLGGSTDLQHYKLTANNRGL
jgi:hypothetical protein